MSHGAVLQKVEERDAEIDRLKFKINALADAIRDHASKAAQRRIVRAMKRAIAERYGNEASKEVGDGG